MNKVFKYFIILSCLVLMISCNKESKPKNDDLDIIDYPTYEIEEYNKMETYIYNETISNIKYKYTYFFDKDMCVNSKEELTFKDNNSAKEFYDEAVNLEDYLNVTIKGNVVTYYNNPEYFMYMMYPKDMLIELLTEYNDSDE